MINLDHNASTPTLPHIWEKLAEAQDVMSYNPDSQHEAGFRAKALLENSRRSVLELLKLPKHYAVFTSGATESNGTVLLSYKALGYGIVALATEHKSVLKYADYICKVDSDGQVDLDHLKYLLKTADRDWYGATLACMYANNETGVISDPNGHIAELCKAHEAHLHVDASQCYGKDSVLPDHITQNASTITLSGHKMGALKGIGALLFKPELHSAMTSPFRGGAQEYGFRPGTPNLPGAYSMALAIHSLKNYGFAQKTDKLIRELSPLATVNSTAPRLPNTVNFRFMQIPAELLIAKLSEQGFMISGMSACDSGISEPSHVIRAMYPHNNYAEHSVRISLGHDTTDEQLDAFIAAVRHAVESSPDRAA